MREFIDLSDFGLLNHDQSARLWSQLPVLEGKTLLVAMLSLGLLGLVAFALLYWRKLKLQDSVETQFKVSASGPLRSWTSSTDCGSGTRRCQRPTRTSRFR